MMIRMVVSGVPVGQAPKMTQLLLYVLFNAGILMQSTLGPRSGSLPESGGQSGLALADAAHGKQTWILSSIAACSGTSLGSSAGRSVLLADQQLEHNI